MKAQRPWIARFAPWFALALLIVVPILTVMLPGAPGLPAPARAADAGAANAVPPAVDGVPRPVFDVDTTTQCVLPAARMRLEHPALLTHQRDRAVHLGLNEDQISLKACVQCHAGPGAGRSAGAAVGAPQAFCESCHRYVAVQLDCFGCHQSRPVADAGVAR